MIITTVNCLKCIITSLKYHIHDIIVVIFLINQSIVIIVPLIDLLDINLVHNLYETINARIIVL